MANCITIIIPNYNGIDFTINCLDSLKKQSMQDFDVFVIDNASTDGSIEYIHKYYPEIRLICLKKNYGFTGAVNYGLSICKTKYVILLNNDTVCEPNFVSELYYTISSNDSIFSVSSKMVKMQNEHIVDDAGDIYTVFGWSLQRGTREPCWLYSKPCRVFSSCGGASIYRMDIIKKIGSFDPMFFAYLEDLDLGYRARLYGYENWYCPSAIVHHIGSASTGGTLYSNLKVYLSARNNLFLTYPDNNSDNHH